MVHAKNSSAWEVEAGVSGVHSHPQLHSEFKASLGIENMAGGGGKGRQEERKEGRTYRKICICRFKKPLNYNHILVNMKTISFQVSFDLRFFISLEPIIKTGYQN